MGIWGKIPAATVILPNQMQLCQVKSPAKRTTNLRMELLIVQDYTEERTVDLQAAVVLNETKFPELVHKEIDPRSRGAHHFSQRFLGYFVKHLLRFRGFSITSKQ